ncbi:hypothetical protein Q6346_14815 [Isoptericola sp. b490]|uniref:hypothetical protein n=1 Tax=Actinotalea lenta TaxID=3064654 RepID=UPI0027137B3E|nr:hypothetical protein [Isoptericola sp. b490]MDO8122580.1 hypothetical protein [Isoptericola sp. b490]
MPSNPRTGAAAPIVELPGDRAAEPTGAALANPPANAAPPTGPTPAAEPAPAPTGGPSGPLPDTPGGSGTGPGGTGGGTGTGPGGGPAGTGGGTGTGPGGGPGGTGGGTGGTTGGVPVTGGGLDETQVGEQLASSLLDLVTNATSGDAVEAQRIILRRIALQGDIVPSRVPAPLNITQIGGYLNLLESLGQTDMELQTLAGILGVAGTVRPQGLLGGAPALTLVPVANDRPPGPAQPSLPVVVAFRSDLAPAVRAALSGLHDVGAVLPMLGNPTGLPVAGLAAAVPDPLPYLGRVLTVASAYATQNAATDPLLLARPSGSTDPFELTARAAAPTAPADLDVLVCTSSSCVPLAQTGVRAVPVGPALASAGFYPADPPPQPASSADTAWARYTNTTGLVAGTRLGDELALLYTWDTIAGSVYSDHLDWVWTGTTFDVAGSPTTGTAGTGTAGTGGTGGAGGPAPAPGPGPAPAPGPGPAPAPPAGPSR